MRSTGKSEEVRINVLEPSFPYVSHGALGVTHPL